MQNQKTNSINASQIITPILCLMLFFGLFDMPYAYYTVIRFCMMIWLGIIGFAYLGTTKKLKAYAFLILAIVYNPIIPFELGKAIWVIVNVTTIVMLLTTLNYLNEVDGKLDIKERL